MKYPNVKPSTERMLPQSEQVFASPSGYDAHTEHHRTFWAAVRSRTPVVEDAVFGFRAAGPALLCNSSYFDGRVCQWDPEAMRQS